MQLKEILQKTTQFLKDKGSPSARLDTELLLSAALKWERIKLYVNFEYPMTEAELTVAREFVRRRAAGEPVAYILGKKDFYNHTFKVSSAVLIPRPETETIVDTAIQLIKNQTESIAKIVDLGTGSGCIGLSILADTEVPRAIAIDISPEAIAVARENAGSLGLSERIHFLTGDAGKLSPADVKAMDGHLADMIVANPPYIDPSDPLIEANVKKYEPRSALYSANGGLDHIREWSLTASEIGREGAFVMFEIGADQGASAHEIFTSIGRFRDVKVVKDLFGRERFIQARVARQV